MSDDIVLRPWIKEDASQLAAIANNRNIWLNVRDRFPHPYTVGDAVQWLAATKDQQPVQTMAIIYKDAVAGSIGVLPKEDVYRKSIEIGYFVGEPFWGNGIATRSVALLLQFIENHYDVVRIFAEVFEHNIASMKVLENNGFHLEGIRQKSVFKNSRLMNDHVYVKFI